MALADRAEKKLKRGLEDLSPLFQKKPAKAPPPVSLPAAEPFGVQFITVCVPDHEGDAFLVNAYLASQLVREAELSASLISINQSSSHAVERLDRRISRLHLSHEEIWSLTQRGLFQPERAGLPPSAPDPRSFIFLELESAHLRSLARAALLLDRVILFVQPEVDSLQEGYRLIKSLWQLNHDLEFFLLFRGPVDLEERKEFLFERFSLIASRFLGFSPGWLGELAFPEGKDQPALSQGKASGFDSAPLFSSVGLHRPLSPEKGRFWQEIRKILGNGHSHDG